MNWEQENLVIMGYLCATREMNNYQKEWREKNADKCQKYLSYRCFSNERKKQIREYQKEYYKKKAAEKNK